MIEKIGNNNKELLVTNYSSNFDIKEFIQESLIPKAFPNIPVNKLNLGFTGIVSEMLSNAIEDSYGTASLMMNESFITRSVLANSIYSEASLFNLGYSFATPSICSFALELWLPDIIKYATKVKNSNIYRYCLDKNTKIMMNENSYSFDYDIYIDFQSVGGKTVFNIYYNIEEINSISKITNKYIKHQVSSINWLILFVDLQEFDRKVDSKPITDNLVTVNSDISISWSRQLAGIDLVYISPQGERLPMELKVQYTNAEIEPFVWYKFYSDNTIKLMFSNNSGYFQPAFNSSIEWTIYTCNGKSADFESYDRKAGVPVQKKGDKYSYNANTRMTALCYGPSHDGLDKGDIEDLRNEVIYAYNTVNVLTSDHDLKMWFNKYAKQHNTYAEFFTRRDDPSGKLFSQFIAIKEGSYIYPTNTLTIDVKQDQFDFINSKDGVNQEFIIKPGHLWEYADEDGNITRDRVRMVTSVDGVCNLTDEILPSINDKRPFLFVNPFYIKIYRDPTISVNYNCLVNHTSWPEDVPIQTDCFYKFQLATFSIERSISKKYDNKYRIEVICVPVVTTDTTIVYVEGIGDSFPKYNNNLRLILITRSREDGETGYIEMDPVEFRPGGAILFRTDIAIHDNINSDMILEIDKERTPNIHSLINNGPRVNKVVIDAEETSFHFITIMKDPNANLMTNLFGNEEYNGYVMTNRFSNVYRDLTLYKPMNMMRSVITFAGSNDNYEVRASLIPFLRYDIPLDDTKMSYFIRCFNNQYKSMEPIISKLGGAKLDIKLYNTYGRSNNYYIGPKEGDNVLWNSDILLDNVYVKVKFVMAVYDRSLWSQTSDAVINEITLLFEGLQNEGKTEIHSSDIIHIIIENHSNVKYFRFIGFNDYDANKSSIFVKYSDTSELQQSKLQTHVPEIIRVDKYSIEITEEV